MRRILGVAAVLVLLAVPAARAQPAPITVDGDTITYDSVRRIVTAQGRVRVVVGRYRVFADTLQYDLNAERVTATGRVRVLDDQRRELRGRSLTYHVRTEEGILEPADGIVDAPRRVYIRGARVDFSPARLLGRESILTSCDPQRPFVYVTARRIEIVPNEELVAYDASLFVGNRRIYSTSRFEVSLIPGEPAVLIPGFGNNEVDGYWIDMRSRVRLPGVRGILHTKYGQDSGLFALLTLSHRQPAFTTTLRVGRTQTGFEREGFELLRYSVAEVSASLVPVPIGGMPLSWSVAAAAAWFDDPNAGVATTRLDGTVALESRRLALAPALTFGAEGALRISAYGTGAVRTITAVGADLTYRPDPRTSVRLGYALKAVRGATPLIVDGIDPEDSVSFGVTRIVPNQYRASVSVAHNRAVPETTLSGGLAVVLSPSFDTGASAKYNFRTHGVKELEYYVRYTCDCIEVIFRYRQERREVSLEVGLAGLSERGAPFVPRVLPQRTLPPESGTPDGGNIH